MKGMKALGVELYKQRRTGLLTVLLVVGWLDVSYAALLFGPHGGQLLALPLTPMDVLLTQLYGVLCVLNIFGIVMAACLACYLEFSGNAIRKLCVLPLAGGQISLWKFVIIAAGLLAAWVIQYAAIALVGLRYLSSGAFDVVALVAFAAYTLPVTLPIVSLMLLVASRFTSIWVPLGVGVAGFPSGIALATAKSPIWLGHPFAIVFQPAITTAAVPNPLVIAIAIVETVLFGGLGLVLSQYKAYEWKELVVRFTSLLAIELMKVRRSFIIPLIFIAPVVVIISGASSLRMYLTLEYKNAWAAMFIQGCLLYAYYLLPFSMIVVCVLIAARESAHNGVLKVPALPVSRRQLNLAKFVVVLSFSFLEMLIYLVVFLVAGLVTAHTAGVSQAIPVAHLLGKCTGLFFAMIPSVALMWLIAVVFNRPVLSTGIDLLLVIPGILVANTPLWIFYPCCYGGYLIATVMTDYQNNVRVSSLDLFPFLPCATGPGLAMLYLSTVCFGEKEMR